MPEKTPYKSLAEWRKNDASAYKFARINNRLDELCEKFGWKRIYKIKSKIKLTLTDCLLDAKQCKTRGEWKRKFKKSYSKAVRAKWLDVCCKHMDYIQLPNGYWTKERCIEEAKKYKTKTEWSINSSSSYTIAHKNGWLDECTKHMKKLIKPKGYWTKERCIEEARKCKNISEWQKNSSSSYGSAKRNGWVNEIKELVFNV